MKQDSLQQLLAKYQEGTLDEGELEQLNALTHRDEVMAAAVGRARTIVRRRTMRTVGLAVATAAVLGAGVWMLTPRHEEPMIASTNFESSEFGEQSSESSEFGVRSSELRLTQPDNSDIKTTDHESLMHSDNSELRTPNSELSPHPNNSALRTPHSELDELPEIRATETEQTEPVVVCNSQCDADSVISDIWKFLSA